MNKQEKEQYLREYAILKSQGKPFFPYAILKDGTMAAITLAVIIALSLILGAELGPKADPTTTSYTPRPEWYFFFLFELLRVIKPPALVFIATIGVPTICMVLLILLPFIDRNPERHPAKRPIAVLTAVTVIALMAYLTVEGALAGAPGTIDIKGRPAIRAGKGGGGPIGLPGLPQDRRERQRRAGPGPDPYRGAAAAQRDRPHAREPHGPDAVVHQPSEAAPPGVQRSRRLSREPQVGLS